MASLGQPIEWNSLSSEIQSIEARVIVRVQAAGQVVISPELHQRVWQRFQAEAISVATKHEGDFKAFRILSAKG